MAHARGGLGAEGRVLGEPGSPAFGLELEPGPRPPARARPRPSLPRPVPHASQPPEPLRKRGVRPEVAVATSTQGRKKASPFPHSFRASLQSPRGLKDESAVLRAGKAPPLATAHLSPRPFLPRRPNPRRGRPGPPEGRPEAAPPGPGGLRLLVTSRGSSRGVTPLFPRRGAAAERVLWMGSA